MKTVDILLKTRHRRPEHVGSMLTLVAATYNLVCLPKLLVEAA